MILPLSYETPTSFFYCVKCFKTNLNMDECKMCENEPLFVCLRLTIPHRDPLIRKPMTTTVYYSIFIANGNCDSQKL